LQQAEKAGRDSIQFLLDISHLYLNNRDKITELGLDPLLEAARIVGEIEKLMSSAKETDSDRPDHAEMLADTYRAMGEEEKALEQYEKLLEEYPTLPRLKEKRANALFALDAMKRLNRNTGFWYAKIRQSCAISRYWVIFAKKRADIKRLEISTTMPQ
jgi:predicted Zn-dependent protease